MNENYSADQSHAGGGLPPYQAAPPQQPRRGFFDTIRSSGYFRGEPRIVGGVLSGLSQRYGWDPTLLRVLLLIATLFFPLLASVYALGWFLLPEQRDGRIHAEALTLGYFDIAQLGAGVLFLMGLGNSALWTSFTLGFEPIVVFVLAIPIIAIVGIVALVNLGKPKNTWQAPPTMTGTPPGAHPSSAPFTGGMPSAGGPGAPTSGGSFPSAQNAAGVAPGGSAPAGYSAPSPTPAGTAPAAGPAGGPSSGPIGGPGSGCASVPGSGPLPNDEAPAADWRTQGGPPPAAAPAPAPQGSHIPHAGPTPATPYGAPPAGYAAAASYPMAAAPRPFAPPVRGIPMWVNLLVTGLVVLTMTAVFAALTLPEFAVLSIYGAGQLLLIGGGGCLLLVAIPMMIAALKGRSAYWLVALSILGIILAFPTTMAGLAMTNDWGNHYRVPYGSTIPQIHYGSDVSSIGSVSNATWDFSDLPNSDTSHYEADQIFGELIIYVRQGQPIEIRVHDSIGVISADYQDGSHPWVQESLGLQVGTTMRSVSDPKQKVTTLDIKGVLGSLLIVETPPNSDYTPPAVEAPPAVDKPQSAAVTPDSSQSAPGSADAPQSAATR